MRFRVPIAIFAILGSFLCGPVFSPLTPPAHAAVAQPPSQPDGPYAVYAYINGYPEDVTTVAAYNEDHVFLLDSYVYLGERTGTNGETIVNNGFVVGYLQPL
jgi:hypothetical protein